MLIYLKIGFFARFSSWFNGTIIVDTAFIVDTALILKESGTITLTSRMKVLVVIRLFLCYYLEVRHLFSMLTKPQRKEGTEKVNRRKRTKQMLAVIITLAMLVSTMLTVPTLANVSDPQAAQEAAEALHSIRLMDGYGNDSNGNPMFGLNDSMNRVFGAVLFLKLVGEYDAARGSGYTHPFTDVPEWADVYIAYAYEMEYTSGVSETEFGPDMDLTATMFLTLMLKALGYEMGVDFQWDSAWTLTDQLGITNGEFHAGNNSLLRGDMAVISIMTLGQPLKGFDTTLIEVLVSKDVVPWNAAEVVAYTIRSLSGSTTPPVTRADVFYVGSGTMSGNFISGFGNNSNDASIVDLVSGYYETYYVASGGDILLNRTVVSNVATSTDASGNKTYTFTLHNDLKWSDGSALTARDYVAGALLYASPDFREEGAYSTDGEGLIGFDAFSTGSAVVFAGIRLIDTYQFSATISYDELPNFWETAYVSFFPIPLSAWLTGINIASDASGSRFDGNIAGHCQRIVEKERFAPSISCGPYMFENYDGSSVTLKRNPYFKGDPYGNLPAFEYVVQREIDYDYGMTRLINGDIDLLPGVFEAVHIERAKANPNAVAHSYLRAGYGHIAFHVDWGPTADVNVRWAIAHIIDRNTVIDRVLGGYGATVDASYGIGQWTYQARRSQLESRLTPINLNLSRANDLLDQTVWRFEADGVTPFDRSKANPDGTYMRYNSSGEMLVIQHLSASSVIGGAIEAETGVNAPLVGMSYVVTYGDFQMLLDHYYYGYDLGSERFYSAFNMATNFGTIDDKFISWHSSNAGSWYNASQLRDSEIDRITVEMRRLDPTETEKYANLWVEFQVRWQQLLPHVPLYSNENYDVFNSSISSVPSTAFTQWHSVICQIQRVP